MQENRDMLCNEFAAQSSWETLAQSRLSPRLQEWELDLQKSQRRLNAEVSQEATENCWTESKIKTE